MGNYLAQGPYMPVPFERARLGLDLDLVADYGASGSNQNTTGSIAANTNILILDAPIDFLNEEGISVIGANGGPFQTDGVTPLAAPASLAVTPTGGTATTPYKYYCAAMDENFGVTASVSHAIANGEAVLSATVNNAMTVPAVTGTAGYIWWGDASNPAASQGILGITPGPSFEDIGMGSVLAGAIPPGAVVTSSGLYYLPVAPPAAAVADVFRSTIVGGAGTNRLILADYAKTTVTGQYVGHNDNQAFIDFTTDAIAQGRQGHIPDGDYVIDKNIFTDVSPGAGLIALYLYGQGNALTSTILDFYSVVGGFPWQIDNPSLDPIYGLTLKGFDVSLWNRESPFTISATGFNALYDNFYYDADIDIFVNNVGPVADISYIIQSNINLLIIIIYENDVTTALPLQLTGVEYNKLLQLTVYSNAGDVDNVFIKFNSETGGNTLLGMICDGAIEFADATCADNTFINPYISFLSAALVNSGSGNMLINPEIVSIDTPSNPAALTIIGGPYDNYAGGSGEGGSVTDYPLTTTNPTNVVTVTVPAFNKGYKINFMFDVKTAPTTVQAQVTWTNPNTGAQTWVWESGASLLEADSHMELPLLILAEAGSTITITMTAGTASQVFATASIEPQ